MLHDRRACSQPPFLGCGDNAYTRLARRRRAQLPRLARRRAGAHEALVARRLARLSVRELVGAVAELPVRRRATRVARLLGPHHLGVHRPATPRATGRWLAGGGSQFSAVAFHGDRQGIPILTHRSARFAAHKRVGRAVARIDAVLRHHATDVACTSHACGCAQNAPVARRRAGRGEEAVALGLARLSVFQRVFARPFGRVRYVFHFYRTVRWNTLGGGL